MRSLKFCQQDWNKNVDTADKEQGREWGKCAAAALGDPRCRERVGGDGSGLDGYLRGVEITRRDRWELPRTFSLSLGCHKLYRNSFV